MPKTPRLPDVAQYYLDSMLPDQRAQLDRAVARVTAEGRPLRIGTACSGTESPIVVFKALAKVMPALTFEHVFSCEFCEKKRAWIYDNFPGVPMMFLDVRQALTKFGRRRSCMRQLNMYAVMYVCICMYVSHQVVPQAAPYVAPIGSRLYLASPNHFRKENATTKTSIFQQHISSSRVFHTLG